MKKIILFPILIFFSIILLAQPHRFAHITDTHIGGKTASEDLTRIIEDLNTMTDLDFALFTGDITEFGSDDELTEAKSIISKLKMPWYIVPGNHDAKWSESGCNSFVRTFGAEGFCFEKKGILFIGTASGPNMRMAPGLVPREQIVFLDSVLQHTDVKQPIIFVNHYPLDESLSNWDKVVSMLKTRNVQATLLGHGHTNKLYDFSGISGIMGRSALRASKEIGGYNIATLENDTLYYRERTPGKETLSVWCKVPIGQKIWIAEEPIKEEKFPDQLKTVWEFQDKSDIGTNLSVAGNVAVYANTVGEIVALNAETGKAIWKYQTQGKVYSTPSIAGSRVVAASTDGNIYCLSLKNGKVLWQYNTPKAIVASPVIDGDRVFCGASDGCFRSLSLKKGEIVWQFDSVKNFVETRPLVTDKAVYFGSWGNTFYALDKQSGQLLWKREKYANRMLSPAAVWPVAAQGKVFIVAPDRHMTALDAETGAEIWDSGKYSCRESIGVSQDGKLVYIKNMTEGNVLAFDAEASEQKLVWECPAGLDYEIGPSPLLETGRILFVPTGSGRIVAVNTETHQKLWDCKISVALVNGVQNAGKNRIVATTLDGKVVCLEYQPVK